MRKNHHGKKDRLVKRVFALCLALAVICTCLVPVFATEYKEVVDSGNEEVAGFGDDFPAVDDGEPREVYDDSEAAGFGGDEVATRPVEGGEDNFTYVNTDVYGDFSLAGSIFLDVNCDKNFTDPYSLLYGHHMEESKMFGDLDLYKDAEFFAENTTGELILPDRTYDLQTFACLLVPASENAIFDPQRWDSDLQGLYTFAQENALNLNTETLAAMKAAGDDAQVLALSTCSTEFTDARTILLAWMIPSASDS